jgi:hypothetical protein
MPVPAADDPAAALRASDAERDAVAGVLAEALATGRLSPEEHAERLEAVYASRTRGELVPLTRDLPDTGPETGWATPPDTGPVEALFGQIRRGGQWPVPPHTLVRARFGKVIIDLRHAVFTRREVVVDANTYCGKVIVLVPPDAQVYDTGSALFGKRTLPGGKPARPGRGKRSGQGGGAAEGPVIRITGRSVFGKVVVARSFKWPWHEWR